jgi:hypothetical protein
MLLILLFLFILLGYSTNTITVVTDYPGKHEGWITIELDKNTLNGKRAAVQKITWCASTTPNPKVTDKNDPDYAPPPEDIDNCKARGLQHLQLYPNPHPLVRQEAEEPGVVYIDPANVGGWDSDHQADIIVEADIGGDTKLVQVVRFNVPRILVESNHPPSPPVVPSPPPVVVSPSSPPSPVAISSSPPSVSIQVEEEQQQHESPPPLHPWKSVAFVFGIGLLVLAVGIFVSHYSRSPREWVAYAKRQAKLRGFIKTNPTEYDFLEQRVDTLPFVEDDEENNEDVVEMDDLAILMRMGKGATPAFRENL